MPQGEQTQRMDIVILQKHPLFLFVLDVMLVAIYESY
jgi:hypothetical protein